MGDNYFEQITPDPQIRSREHPLEYQWLIDRV